MRYRFPRGWRSLLISVAFFLVNIVAAQIPSNWEPIAKSDLEMVDNPAEPGASAIILDRQVYVDDQKRFQTNRMKIKVLKEDGRNNADVEIPYDAKEGSIEDLRARTVRKDGTELPFNGVIYDKVLVKYKKYRYNAKTFTLPGVEVGSIIEYGYTYKWKQPLPDVVRNPGDYIITSEISYPTFIWTVQNTLFTRHARFTIRPEKGMGLYWVKVRLPNSDPARTSDGLVKLELENIPALEQEPFMPPESMLNSRVHFFYGSRWQLGFWEHYATESAKDLDAYIGKNRAAERIVAGIVAPGDSSEARLRKIYDRVQMIRNLSFEPEKTNKQEKREQLSENKNVDDILEHGYARGNEVNFLFVAMARAAGFDSSIIALVDRRSDVFDKVLKDTSQLNALIVQVIVDGRRQFFDPATRFCPYGILPWYESDATGILWDKSSASMIGTPVQESSAAIVKRNAELRLEASGELDGRLRVEFSGQEAMERRLQAVTEDSAGRLKQLEDEITSWLPIGAVVDEVGVNSWDSAEAPLIVTCHVHVPQFASASAKRIFFTPAVFEVNRKEILRQFNRVHTVYFQHAYEEDDTVSYAIPQGYLLEALPGNFEQSTGYASFHATYSHDGRSIQFKRSSEVHGYFIPSQYYSALRRYLRAESESDAKNVLLKKQMH